MQHRGQQRVGHPVTGHVHHGDAGLPAAPFEFADDVGPAVLLRARDPGIQIVALLEVDVHDVVAARRAGERQ